ncbi:MAG: DNA repair exonuclease [Eubacteriales bacterium]|nr:DNA repair exonuclease [Eubacteriales bacterium]MDD3883071.1 DNA repair exonuclease [Eubacteriales bacterium]MDD4513622.1 DNA repair exonuclease [Eubacteriales bacterium]
MPRILLTGDEHIGRDYSTIEKEDAHCALRLREARLEALQNAVRAAEDNACDYFVIAGDLFDKTEIDVKLVKKVCGILAECPCPVIVLPGNHDYCAAAGETLWKQFCEYKADNTVLLSSPCAYDAGKAVFYPCPCEARYSEVNALGWLSEYRERSAEKPNIGIAHGALAGLSCDREKRYFSMTEDELSSLGMQLWLIGHTHIPYPAGDEIIGASVFNAGTHQQTDIADSAEGSVFIIDIDKSTVRAKRIKTGVVSFVRRALTLSAGDSLSARIMGELSGLESANTVFRLKIGGILGADEFRNRAGVYDELRERLLRLETDDGELKEEITAEMIDAETLEGTAENRLLKRYLSSPRLLETAYLLIKRVKDGD